MSNPFSRLLIAVALPALCSVNVAFAEHEHMSNEFEVFLAAEAYHGSEGVHAADDDSWEGMVPPEVAELIKRRAFFGYVKPGRD